MTIDADTCARELVEAYDSGDFQSLQRIVAYPCAVYLDDQVLVLANSGELLRLVTLQKIAAFRTKTGTSRCELVTSKLMSPTSVKATVRFFSRIHNATVGNMVYAHMYMRHVDGLVKFEMMEIIEYNANTPLVMAIRQLSTTKHQVKSISN